MIEYDFSETILQRNYSNGKEFLIGKAFLIRVLKNVL